MHRAIELFGHALTDDLFTFDQVGDQFDVRHIADDAIGLGNDFTSLVRHVFVAAWADADQRNFAAGR